MKRWIVGTEAGGRTLAMRPARVRMGNALEC